MTNGNVEKLFSEDVKQFHEDAIEASDARAYWGPGVQSWSDELDLFVFEEREEFWYAFDTHWTVRAGFDRRGKLVKHEMRPFQCCGP